RERECLAVVLSGDLDIAQRVPCFRQGKEAPSFKRRYPDRAGAITGFLEKYDRLGVAAALHLGASGAEEQPSQRPWECASITKRPACRAHRPTECLGPCFWAAGLSVPRHHSVIHHHEDRDLVVPHRPIPRGLYVLALRLDDPPRVWFLSGILRAG